GDRVALRSEQGQVVLPCQPAKAGELPPGLLFLPYGDASSRLMGGDTHGTGMPNSKGLDVELKKAGSPPEQPHGGPKPRPRLTDGIAEQAPRPVQARRGLRPPRLPSGRARQANAALPDQMRRL